MPALVYALSAATSILCTIMLLRGYFKSGVRLLLWSGLCFLGLALDNVFLYADEILFHDVSHMVLTLGRRLPGLIAMSLLLFGLIWEAR